MSPQHLISLLLLVTTTTAPCAEKNSPPKTPVENKSKPAHTNRLAKEKSPYLLQHAHNPVDWYPWGEEAFARAKKENKPILLSIGYSTCHWCHVMERESFEKPEIAKHINDAFIAIKLDREERPDVDNIYMTAMQALELGGGWPLNVFLTPDLKPFYGGTYFRPADFTRLLDHVAATWKEKPGAIADDANNVTKHLARAMEQLDQKPGTPRKEWITQAAKSFSASFDPKHGGFGGAPKFPQPQISELILLVGNDTGNQAMIDQVLFTLRRMTAGGIYDQLGGGFSRYSVDAQWLVPHFEKMLYDNGQLVNLLLNAYLLSKDEIHAETVRDVLTYVQRDMTHPGGGFYSAEDADSEGHEGKFYCWTEEELQKLLTSEEFTFAKDYYGITKKGNFHDHSHPQPLSGQNILSIIKPETKLDKASSGLLATLNKKLLTERSKRIRPHLDDKMLVSWNGLMLSGMARAGIILANPTYIAAARKNISFVRQQLWDEGSKTLYHRYRDGQRDSAQLLTAYAFYLQGVLDTYQATLDPKILDFASEIAESMIRKFYDAKHGGFFASADQKELIFRAKDNYDGAEPSGNSVAILSLLKLAAITDQAKYKEPAETSLKLFANRMSDVPQAVPMMLQACHFLLKEPRRAVVAGYPDSPETQAMLQALHRTYQPAKVILGTVGKVEEVARGMKAASGKATAYICTGTACLPPTTDPKAAAASLKK